MPKKKAASAPTLKVLTKPINPGQPFQWSNGLTEVWWTQDSWDFEFHFLHGGTCKNYDEWLRHVTHGSHSLRMDEETEDSSAFHMLITGGYGPRSVVFLKDKWTGTPRQMGALTHELIHCIMKMLAYKGVKPSEDSEEAYAYLAGSIFEDLMRVLGLKYFRPRPWIWVRTDKDKPVHPTHKK